MSPLPAAFVRSRTRLVPTDAQVAASPRVDGLDASRESTCVADPVRHRTSAASHRVRRAAPAGSPSCCRCRSRRPSTTCSTVPADPGPGRRSVPTDQTGNAARSTPTTGGSNRMAHDSPRPIQETDDACSGTATSAPTSRKVGDAELMQQQIDALPRRRARQPADARPDDVDPGGDDPLPRQQRQPKASPNQNFGRELMELFMLGVGNYTEADVEASTAAWTGHTDDWETDAYVWRADWHDNTTKSFLGARSISTSVPTTSRTARGDRHDARRRQGAGSAPTSPTAAATPGRSRPSSSRGSCGRSSPAPRSAGAVLAATARRRHRQRLRRSRRGCARCCCGPSSTTRRAKQGLVRSPIDVRRRPAGASRQALGGRHAAVADGGHGPAPLFPPNVSGWKAQRLLRQRQRDGKRTGAQMFFWRLMDTCGTTPVPTGVDHARRAARSHGPGRSPPPTTWPADSSSTICGAAMRLDRHRAVAAARHELSPRAQPAGSVAERPAPDHADARAARRLRVTMLDPDISTARGARPAPPQRDTDPARARPAALPAAGRHGRRRRCRAHGRLVAARPPAARARSVGLGGAGRSGPTTASSS